LIHLYMTALLHTERAWHKNSGFFYMRQQGIYMRLQGIGLLTDSIQKHIFIGLHERITAYYPPVVNGAYFICGEN